MIRRVLGRWLLALVCLGGALFAARAPGLRVAAAAPMASPVGRAQASSHLALRAEDAVLPVLDPAFAPRFEVEGVVRAIAVQPDNKVIIAGAFDTVNGQARRDIARLNADGSLDPTFALSAPFVFPNPDFYALALLPDGKLLVGGTFNMMGGDGRLRHCLARLHPDGALDDAFFAGNYNGGGLDGTVRALLRQSDGQILIGGAFSQILGTPRQGVARLNPNGSVDAGFDPGDGADGAVLALARQADGKVLIGGGFTSFDGAAALRIARVNDDGSLDTGFTVAANDTVNAVAVQPNGDIVLGGAFTAVNSETVYNVVRVQPDGTLGPAMAGMLYEAKSVLALADNAILVGGWNSSIIFQGRPLYHDARIVKYDSEGTLIGAVSFDGHPTEVNVLAQRPDGAVVAGGHFRNLVRLEGMPVVYRHSLGLFSPALAPAPDFQPLVASAGEVREILPLPNGDWMALGRFSLVNGVPRVAAARMTSAGALDPAFTPPFRRFTNELRAGVILPDGSFLVGGGFTDNYTDQSLTGQTLVRLSSQGDLLDFPRYAVSFPTLALDADGKILLGGGGAANFPGILRLHPDGSQDASFDPGAGLGGAVEADGTPGHINAILPLEDGRIIVAGKFSDFSGSGRGTIVRLGTDGAVDASFAPPVFDTSDPIGRPQVVYALAQQCEPVTCTGKLLVGGNISVATGATTHRALVRLAADGGLDTAFVAPFEMGGAVRALARLRDGTVLAGGSLQVIAGGQLYSNLFYLMPSGARQPAFTSSVEGARLASIVGSVQALAIGAGEQALVGGHFVAIEDAPRASMGAYHVQPIVSTTIDPATGGALLAPAEGMAYLFPTGAFSETVVVAHSPRAPSALPAVSPLVGSAHAFDVTAVYSSSGQTAQLLPGRSFTVTIAPLDLGVIVPGTAALWWWDTGGGVWSQAGITSTVTTAGGQVTMTAQIDHLSLFAVLGETRRVYLPLVMR